MINGGGADRVTALRVRCCSLSLPPTARSMADLTSGAPAPVASTSSIGSTQTASIASTSASAAVRTATSFSPILPEGKQTKPDGHNSSSSSGSAHTHADATASSATSAADSAAVAASPSPADLAVVGAYLYAKLNYLFHHHPLIDELGLVLAVPSGGGTLKKQPVTGTDADGAASTPASVEPDPSVRFDALHPAPALLLQLQSENCSPMVVIEQSKLGIAFWSIPILVRYTMLRFQALRAQLRTQGLTAPQLTALLERALAEAGPDTTLADLFERAGPQTTLPLPLELLCCTRVLLLINADNYTAWNIRKLLLSMPPARSLSASPAGTSVGSDSAAVSTTLLPASRELLFLNIVYSKHPKSGESWSHRRWVLSRLEGLESKYHFGPQAEPVGEDQHVPKESVPAVTDTAPAAPAPASNVSLYSSALFQAEIAMCERSAELYPKNYYAWMHRQWMVERITDKKELEAELHRVGEWTESHINDYSGFFHRQVLWNQMLTTCAHEADADPARPPLSKADKCAQVHASLPLQLRHWSKRFPHHEFVDDAAMAAAMGTMAVDGGVAAAPVSAAAASSAPTSADAAAAAADSTRALHASLACCSFCSLFSSLEWGHLNELQLRYPGHESLWMYRRFVWHVHVAAIGQHAEGLGAMALAPADAAPSVSPSSPAIPPPAAYPSIPSWLLPLAQRELAYADFQIADRELANWAENRVAALIYKIWVVHSTLTLVYRPAMMQRAAAKDGGEPSASFPLFPLLSPAHRAWYLSMLHALNSVQPKLMSREHWKQRTQACINSAMHAASARTG